jgi:chromate transporter
VRADVPFGEATRTWARVAAQSFGGPAGQIAVLHRVVVDEKGWLDEEQFLHALGYCMLLPGPEAQQMATYIGWLLHGTRGGLVAGGLFVLPGFLAILGLSIAYATLGHIGVVAAIFFGLKPAVLAIVLEAVVRLRRRAIKGSIGIWFAAIAFIGLFFFGVPFPLLIAAAAIAGWFLVPASATNGAMGRREIGATPSLRRLASTTSIWLAVWIIPVVIVAAVYGRETVLVTEATFFSKVAVVTFGGAYSVLAYVGQQAVEVHGWLTAGEMLDGLGLAETTPGPLIMVVQFVGFLGAYRDPGMHHPIVAGTLASIVTTWVTFVPCFLFIFAGAPYVEWVRGRPRLQAALNGIMAAVIGVVLNLAVWFALHVLFGDVRRADVGVLRLWVPRPASLDPAAAAIAAAAIIAVFRLRLGMFYVLGGGAALGLLINGWG